MKKGFSLIGFLLAALLIGILLKLMITPYQKQATANPQQPQRIQTQSQAKQTVDHVRATLEQAQKAAAKRAEAGLDF